MYVPADVMAYKTWNEDNFDLFIMIQRTGEKTFVMYDDTPIVFRPNRDVYCPSDEMGFIDGFHKPHVDFFHHNGIKDIYDLSDPEKYDRLKLLLYRADVLAVRYQYWKKSVWGSVAFVILAIREGRSLSEIFKRYLRYVPDNGPDRLLKKQLLREARELQRSLKRKHSLLKDIARFFRPKQ